MKTVIEIVREHLVSVGADGLVCPDAECGCKLDDLAPCGGGIGGCKPGYLGAVNDPSQDDWTMWTSKELAEKHKADVQAVRSEGGAA